MQQKQVEGSVEHCGPARSPLLGPGAAHLNQKAKTRGLLKVSQQTHATSSSLGSQEAWRGCGQCLDHCWVVSTAVNSQSPEEGHH